MIKNEHIVLVGVLGIVTLLIFFLVILFYSKRRKSPPSSRTPSEQNVLISELDEEIFPMSLTKRQLKSCIFLSVLVPIIYVVFF